MSAVKHHDQSPPLRAFSSLSDWFRRTVHHHTKLWIAGSATIFAAVPAFAFATQTYGKTQHMEPQANDYFVSIPAAPLITSTADGSSAAAADSSSETTISANVEQNNSSTSVTVNGQSVSVPANGSVQKTIPTSDGNGMTSVSISSQSSSTSTTKQGGFQSSGSFHLNSSTTNTLNTEQTDN